MGVNLLVLFLERDKLQELFVSYSLPWRLTGVSFGKKVEVVKYCSRNGSRCFYSWGGLVQPETNGY